MERQYLIAVVAAAVVYFGHEWLHSGAWGSVPFASGETQAVGLGLAGIALVGTAIAVSVERCDGTDRNVLDDVNPMSGD